MPILLGLIILGLLVGVLSANAKRRRAEAKLALMAAYNAGRSEAAGAQAAEADQVIKAADAALAGAALALSFDNSEALPYGANRVKPTPKSRKVGYWLCPPCEIADAVDIERRLTLLDGRAPEICFTGFPEADEEHLKALAAEKGFRLRTTVTKNLTFLCAGEGPGPAKLEKARGQNCPVISADQFSSMAHNGW